MVVDAILPSDTRIVFTRDTVIIMNCNTGKQAGRFTSRVMVLGFATCGTLL